MASSSTPTRSWRFDVFLSFRGKDTRKTIVSYLDSELKRKGLIVFKDDRKLRTGDSISDELVKAIQESRFAVVVISQDYASSRWCLDELRMIMECKEKETLTVFPIFYDVDPSDVRHQKRTFAEAFDKHNLREKEKAQKWRDALRKVADLSGVDSQKCSDDAAMVHKIVGDISSRLSSLLLPDFSGIFGMDTHWEALDPLLKMGSRNEVRMIGILGMGGIGKTTIAKYLYYKLSPQFLSHCLILDIKKISGSERDLVHLQARFLSEILNEPDFKLKSLEEGSSSIQARLSHQKVLVIFDDVDKPDQLDALARETKWFGPGSLIIITTRDESVLISHGIKLVYKVMCLGDDDALRLFNRFAFKGMAPKDDFLELSRRAAKLVRGLPLALKVFGSHLCGRTKKDWETSTDKLRGDSCMDVMDSLKVSYDGLHVREKIIFLCVACLFSGERVSHVMQLVDDKESDVSNRLNKLAEKSLIDISNGCVIVHDLIQEMAKEIVYEQSPNDPGGRSFLLDAEDIDGVLSCGTVTSKVEGISMNISELHNFPTDDWEFQNMQNLRFLKMYNTVDCTEEFLQSLATLIGFPRRLRLLDWNNCPLTTLPSKLHTRWLVDLRLPFSEFEKLWEGTPSLWNLRRMDLSCSFELKEIPDLSQAANLEELDLSHCYDLVKVPSSFSNFKKLTRLSTRGCRKLEFLPSTAGLKSLEVLNSGACSRLSSFPELSKSIVELYLYETRIKEVLDESIQNLTAVKVLNLSHCRELLAIPSMIGSLTALEILDLSYCKMLSQIPNMIENLTSLRKLNLRGCEGLEYVPNTIGNLTALQVLDLGFCKRLTNIPSTICNLSTLETLTLSGCKMLSAIPPLSSFLYLRKLCLCNLNMLQVPDDIGFLQALLHLDLSGNGFETLPASINQLLLLEELTLCNCKYLQSLPKFPVNLIYLYANDCSSLESISNISENSFRILTLDNCFRLDYDAKLVIQDMMSKPNHMGEFKRWAFLRLHKEGSYGFNHLSKESSLTLYLDQSLYANKPVGFFAEVVVAFETHHNISDFRVCCRWYGEADRIGDTYSCPDDLPSHLSGSSAESHGHLFFSCNFGGEISSGKVSFDFKLDCKMYNDSKCCHIANCSVWFIYSEHDVRARTVKVPTRRDEDIAAGVASLQCQDEATIVCNNVGDIIGMDAHLEALTPLLNVGMDDNFRTIGIWGVGGIGKTTIAKCLYEKHKCQFPYHCFIENIKKVYSEHGWQGLQQQVRSKILGHEVGTIMERMRLDRPKVLVIFDDVDEWDLLQALKREITWFGFGSRIIVTTRERALLDSSDIRLVYEVKCLEVEAAHRLFNRFAFGEAFSVDQVPNGFVVHSIHASVLVQGVPLALKLLGSFLRRKKIKAWEAAFSRLRGSPHKTVMECLRLSYDGLDEPHKDLFLTVAFLVPKLLRSDIWEFMDVFCGVSVNRIVQLLDGEGREIRNNLNMLAEKALINISDDGRVNIHDLIQEMAKEIAFSRLRGSPLKTVMERLRESYDGLDEPHKDVFLTVAFLVSKLLRSDIWKLMNVFGGISVNRLVQLLDGEGREIRNSLNMLAEKALIDISDDGRVNIHDWIQQMAKEIVCELSPNDLGRRKFLWDANEIYNCFKDGTGSDAIEGISLDLFDLSKCPTRRNAFENMPNIKFLRIWNTRYRQEDEMHAIFNHFPRKLRLLDWYECPLKTLPSGFRAECLVELFLPCSNLEKLSEIPDTIRSLTALEILVLSNCGSLSEVPTTIGELTALKRLDLEGCRKLQKIPDTIGKLTALESLILAVCASLLKIPTTIGNLTTLKQLDLSSCMKLEHIPDAIGKLTALEFLTLDGCYSLLKIPTTIGNLTTLKQLDLGLCMQLEHIPDAIGKLTALESLILADCASLLKIPTTIGSLTTLKQLDLERCRKLQKIPDTIGKLTALESLILADCASLLKIPTTIGNLTTLKLLDLRWCMKLEHIPDAIAKLTALKV